MPFNFKTFDLYEKTPSKTVFFFFDAFCYEQTSPLERRKARYGLSFVKLKLVARLLLFPLKSCDFRGPRKADPAFWGKEKQCFERRFCDYSKTKAMSALL